MICLTLDEIRQILTLHQRRQVLGEDIPSISEIARRAGISRQTLYALLRDERSEFGEVAQIRLSRVIAQISADPAYQQTRLMRLSLSPGGPRLRIGTR
jgi:transcriptional regulator with XRE-family HTH domain